MTDDEREDAVERFAGWLMYVSFGFAALFALVLCGLFFWVVPFLFLSATLAVVIGSVLTTLVLVLIRTRFGTKRLYRPPDE